MKTFNNSIYKLSKNFLLHEFKVSNDHPELAENIKFTIEDVLKLKILCLECLQPIREKFGVLFILSGKRNKKLNYAVGGSKTSDHLNSLAADFSLNHDMEHIFKWIVLESGIDFRQIIYYPEQNFIHISCNVPGRKTKKQALIKKGKQYLDFKH